MGSIEHSSDLLARFRLGNPQIAKKRKRQEKENNS